MKLFRVILPVTDIAMAQEFYRAVLAAEGRRVSPGRHYFDVGGVILALYDPVADGDRYALPPNPDHVYIATTEIEAVRSRVVSAGARPDAVQDRPWGERSFYFQDPFGNRLCFVDDASPFLQDLRLAFPGL